MSLHEVSTEYDGALVIDGVIYGTIKDTEITRWIVERVNACKGMAKALSDILDTLDKNPYDDELIRETVDKIAKETLATLKGGA